MKSSKAPLWVKIMKNIKFGWGGDWKVKPDKVHFYFQSGKTDKQVKEEQRLSTKAFQQLWNKFAPDDDQLEVSCSFCPIHRVYSPQSRSESRHHFICTTTHSLVWLSRHRADWWHMARRWGNWKAGSEDASKRVPRRCRAGMQRQDYMCLQCLGLGLVLGVLLSQP